MSKSNDTSKLDDAALKNRVLADSELDAVAGGAFPIVMALLNTAMGADGITKRS